jgi:hypothetical protein
MRDLIKDSFLRQAFLCLIAESGQPRWKEFLKEKYDGGKKLVPNTDNKTKIKYPQVSMNTLYKKDPNFKNKVNKEYKQWLGSDTQQQDLFSKDVDKETEVSLVEVGGRKVPKHQKKFEKKAQSFFNKLNPQGKEWISKFKSGYESAQDKHEFLAKAAVEMPDFFDQFLKSDKDASRFKFGRHFNELVDSWQDGAGLKKSWDIHGFANKLDFNGNIYYGDDDDDMYDDARKEKWGQNVYFYEYNALSYAYAFQQELFKQMGIKSFEVYRGVKDNFLWNEIIEGSMSKKDSVKIKQGRLLLRLILCLLVKVSVMFVYLLMFL